MATFFCGAKVVNFTATAGWDGAESYVSLKLLDDPATSSYFSPPQVGEPKRFAVGGFVFDGIVQNYRAVTGGDGIYHELQLVSPAELMAGATVVLAGDATYATMPNLVNIYGYYESNLFGSANTNDTGMLWDVFTSGLKAIVQETENPLRIKGHTYEINIDSITSGIAPSSNYRIRGEITTINDVINQVCQDAGFNYMVKLNMGTGTHHVIDFVLADRTVQPSLEYINAYLSSSTGNIISRERGVEFRNDYTSAMLIGGNVHELRTVEDTAGLGNRIWPFWGSDVNGNVIIGTGFDDDHTMDLNASPIIDIMGFLGSGPAYTCTVREMRCALDSYDSWANFLNLWRPTLANALKIRSTFATDSLPLAGVAAEYVQDNQTHLDDWSDQAENSDYIEYGQRLYEFVRGYATEYYGKKFLVRIPDYVEYRLVPDTLSSYEYSHATTQSAFLPDGSTPLGLNYYNELFFQDQEGKTNCFVRIDDASSIDLTSAPPEGSVVQTGVVDSLFLQSRPLDFLVPVTFPDTFTTDTCAIIDLGSPILQKPPDPYGGIPALAALLAGPFATSGEIADANTMILEGLGYSQDPPIRLYPAAFKPDAAAIPLRSNRINYGPWLFSGSSPGKVYYEHDDSLTPWEYGDWNAMDAAAMAKLQNIVSDMQEAELGAVDFVGYPDKSLGDILVSGGPNITQITVDFSTGGIKTSYQIETYSHRLYKFYNERANQIKRMGMAFQQIRRGQRIQFFAQRERYFAQMQHKFGQMQRYSQMFRQQSPHHVMVAHTIPDAQRYTHTSISVQKYRDSIFNARIKRSDTFKNSAIVGMETLYRPYATYASSNMAYMRITGSTGTINASSLNPWVSGNDTEWITRGTGEYQRLCTLRVTGINWTNIRAVGFKGPMTMIGWGYDLYTGRPWPNQAGQPGMLLQNMGTGFPNGYARNPTGMIAAPIDFRYDPIRQVWSMPGTIIFGTTAGSITSGGTGQIIMSGRTDRVTITNPWSTGVASGKRIAAAYDSSLHKWLIISADC